MLAELATHLVVIQTSSHEGELNQFKDQCVNIIEEFSRTVDVTLSDLCEFPKRFEEGHVVVGANFTGGEIPADLDIALDGKNYTVCSIDPKSGNVLDCENRVVSKLSLKEEA